MQRLVQVALVASIAVSACSSDDPESAATPSPSSVAATTAPTTALVVETTTVQTTGTTDTPPTTASTTEPAGTSPPTTHDRITEDDLVRFLAATEVPLKGTSLEGAVIDAPEIYIAIAQVVCARFSDGESFDEIADRLLVELESGDRDDDERLVGAIIGAASRTICPEHADEI